MNKEINGFVVLGDYWICSANRYKCNAICKVCNKQFETNYHALPRMKSCGCSRPSQLKPLPQYINGFKTVKCHGYDTVRGVRWATVECKVCKRIYDCDPNKLKYRKHCGCMKKGVIACKYATSHPQLAQTIKHMMARCYNKNNQDYYNYGARGITVCDEWLEDRNKFCEWSLANGFENNKKLSIDRIDSNKGYGPDNCRWVNDKVQSRNTRRVKMTIENAREIRLKHSANPCYSTILNLADEYAVSDATIYLIIQNKTWKE